MRTVVLVPRRPTGDRYRERAWSFVRTHLAAAFPEWPIVEGLHELGPFNRAAAVNRAAAIAGPWDTAVVLDADTFVDPGPLRSAVAAAGSTGRAVLAYREYASLSRGGTDRVVAGYRGSWSGLAKWTSSTTCSSAVAIPRSLWDRVGGLDERFEGWGFEDVALRALLEHFGGTVDRVDGVAWHLWHPQSPERDQTRSEFRAGRALAARYKSARAVGASLELEALAEEARRYRRGIFLLVISAGRRELLADTVASIDRHVKGDLVGRMIHDDSGDPDFVDHLRRTYGPAGFEVVTTDAVGYSGAMRSAWRHARAAGARWVLWHEDDFRWSRDVDLVEWLEVLETNPALAQIVAKRQAWFPRELRAGGLVEGTPGTFAEVDAGGRRWIEHDAFFSVNPTILGRDLLLGFEWPHGVGSEARLGRTLLEAGRRFALWGGLDEEPLVIHTGTERAGHGH